MEDHTAPADKCEKKRNKKLGGCATTLLLRVVEKLKGSKPSSITKVGKGGKQRKMCTEGMSTPTGSKLLRSSSGIVTGVDTGKEEMRRIGEMPPTNWIGGQTFKKTYFVAKCPPEGTCPRNNSCK